MIANDNSTPGDCNLMIDYTPFTYFCITAHYNTVRTMRQTGGVIARIPLLKEVPKEQLCLLSTRFIHNR